jgi:short-subunit dehydrogenase
MSGEVWIVLGATSALARAFALQAGHSGTALLLVGRDPERLAPLAADAAIRTERPVDTAVLDLADAEAIGPAAEAIWAAATALDAGPVNLFVAAGTMPAQADADRDPALIRHTAQATFAGVAETLHRLAPRFGAQGAGRIVVVGSVAGDRGRPSNYAYGAAKAGLHAYLQGLRARLHADGVSVTTVKPGFMDTAMTWGLPGLFFVADPADAARTIWRGAARRRGVVYVPWFWRWIMLIVRLIPEPLFKRLNL